MEQFHSLFTVVRVLALQHQGRAAALQLLVARRVSHHNKPGRASAVHAAGQRHDAAEALPRRATSLRAGSRTLEDARS